jgi:dipeptidyl aminopeptidase/acylaminoacyl peptidase
LLRGIPSRFTKDPAPDTNPLWSPDGSRIVFSASRGGVADLYQKIASGAGNEEVLLNSGESKVPDDWSSDGQFIVYETPNPKTKQDLWVLPIYGDRQPFPFLQTEFNEHQAQFSRDGKWIVTLRMSQERRRSTSRQIRLLVAGGGSRPAAEASRGGGATAKSSSTFPPIEKLMAVDVKLGKTFESGEPKALFGTRLYFGSLQEFLCGHSRRPALSN